MAALGIGRLDEVHEGSMTVLCPKCQTHNSLDSSFCKHCGDQLPADALNDARHEVAQLITQGYLMFNEGRSDEAKAAATMALEADPNNNSAIALRSMCFEREGDIARALEGYERVLEMNPDSALDRIKVNQLRTMLANQATQLEVASSQGSKRAMVTAVGFALLALALGTIGIGYVATRKPAQETTASLVQGPASVESTPFTKPAATTTSTTPPTTDPTTTGNPNPNVTNAVNGGQTNPSSQGNSGQLPPANGNQTNPPYIPTQNTSEGSQNGTSGTNDPHPIFPPAPDGGLKTIPDNTANNQNGKGPDVDPTLQSGATDPNKTDPAKSEGTIEISVTHRNKPNVGGSEDAGQTGGAEALLHTARDQYQVRNFPAAARAYEKALKLGADAGTTNQRLGQCYEQLGKASDAAGAYKRAIAAFEAEVATNPDNRKAKRGLDACKQAVKILGG